MKKIIAAAVAAAFVAPVMAADVTVSGGLSQWIVDDSNDAGTSATRNGSEQYFGISGSSEANNGVVVSGYIGMVGGDGGKADGGDGIKIAHPSFGSLHIGNPSSAVDSVDDKTEVLELFDPLTGNNDTDIAYTLPTIIENLTLVLSYGAEEGDNPDAGTDFSNNGGVNAETDQESTRDESGAAFAYQAGPIRFAYGIQDEASEDNQFMGVQGKLAGFMVAYETNTCDATAADGCIADSSAGNEYESTSLALTYTMGDVEVAYLDTDRELTGTAGAINDWSGFGITYDLGGGASVGIESGESDGSADGGADYTALGVQYSF